MNPFAYTDYKKLLRDAIEARKSVTPNFTAAALAERAGLQRSYLSNVLAKRAELNADQLYVIGEELGWKGTELDYILLLLEIERCTVVRRKRELIARRDQQRSHNTRSETAIGRESISVPEGALIDYFSTPLCSLVHVLMTIEDYRQSPAALRERLGVSERELMAAFKVLEQCSLLRVTKKGYEVNPDSRHLGQTHRLSRVHSTGFRQKAIEYQKRLDNEDDYFFTTTFSASPEVRPLLKAKFLELLKWLAPVVEESKSEDAFHMNFDLFRV